ncbi:MAG: hypothetical protein IVW57_12070 [Ktedonobacterales bacterium]|nr:hypothetical protein [Ktedonobacterales bacterium]
MVGNSIIHNIRGGSRRRAAAPIVRPRMLAVFAWIGARERMVDAVIRPISGAAQRMR